MIIKLKNCSIGKDCNTKIIAEIGINHGGVLENAIRMADLAIKSGADIIKHQTHFVDDEMSEEAKTWKVSYIGSSIYELMDKCSLSKDDEVKLKQFVEKKKKCYLSTPFSRAASNFLNKIGVSGFKIGSGECNNLPLIEHIAKFKKPIILSTGMNDINSVKKSVEILKKYKIDFALMHTNNSYPTLDKDVRLNGILELKKNFQNTLIGYSDHSIGKLACIGAASLGVSLIEKHFTDNFKRKGPDIQCSMNPRLCKEIVEDVKRINLMREGKKGLNKCEYSVSEFAFSSVVSIKEIKKNETFTKKNIWVKRPGTGDFRANEFARILGKKAKSLIKKDIQIKKKTCL